MPNQIFITFVFYILALTHRISPILSQAEGIRPLTAYFEHIVERQVKIAGMTINEKTRF
jgi:hypothetical protein